MEAHTTKRAVLVAEGEARLRALYRIALERDDFEVLLAADGREAVNLYRLHSEKIDLVLMDLYVQKLDGLSAMQQMHKVNPDLICCMISGTCDLEREEYLLDCGAACILQKPLRVADLSWALQHLLERSDCGSNLGCR
jgi:two-component system cell cycle sensor histidine kinase/response regulator CckA